MRRAAASLLWCAPRARARMIRAPCRCVSAALTRCARSLAMACDAGPQICLPDWPWWNRHPLEWLEPLEEEPEKEVGEKKKKKKADKAKAK